jgi:hypothetical protein
MSNYTEPWQVIRPKLTKGETDIVTFMRDRLNFMLKDMTDIVKFGHTHFQQNGRGYMYVSCIVEHLDSNVAMDQLIIQMLNALPQLFITTCTNITNGAHDELMKHKELSEKLKTYDPTKCIPLVFSLEVGAMKKSVMLVKFYRLN